MIPIVKMDGSTDVFKRAGLNHIQHGGVAVADFDDDGDLDFYATGEGPDLLYENRGNGTFVDISAATATNVAIYGMGLGIGDLNDDLIPDFAMSTTGSPVLLESVPGAGIWVRWSTC